MRIRGVSDFFGAVAVGAVASGIAFALAGSASGSAASGSAAAVPAPRVSTGWTQFASLAYTANSSSCTVTLLTSRLSAATPAFIAAEAYQQSAPFTCVGTLQRSTDGGKTWSRVGAPATLPAKVPFDYTFFANTSGAYDGPGYTARACAKAPNAALACTAAITLGAGPGFPPGVVLPASTVQRGTSAGNVSVVCNASLESTTVAKKTTTRVDGVFTAGSSSSAASTLCRGWLETSANNGKTWRVFSATVTFRAPAKTVTEDFVGTHFDGIPHLARVCVQAPAVSAKVYCSLAW